jgi:hypothetical protein
VDIGAVREEDVMVMMKAANDERPSAEVGGYQILGETEFRL